ncbi:MAG: FlgD immunoglobulin-like domain containing protein [Chitinivibrionales bacterium]|nr:FlgD immunoglobulin-like domain containing protein [Chitinivibrionales bacterium]
MKATQTHLGRVPTTVFLVMAFLSVKLYALEQCNLTFTSCPENFIGDTIYVPQSVVALSGQVHACKSSSLITNVTGASAVPSIVFVIDNSGSMTSTSDPGGSRFTVTRALLDTIYKVQPLAEVALVVFQEHLYFDPRTSQYFSKYFVPLSSTVNNDGQPNQAYMRFLTLNATYDGKKGIDVIKDVLATHDSTQSRNTTFTDLIYKPQFTMQPNTNINVAFEAAREAFANAKNPAGQQFVVFLSDGEPRGNSQMGLDSLAFVAGTNVPTTFTVFFTANNQAPSSLTMMIQSIRQNGYSATNPESALWNIQTSYDALLGLFMQNIMKYILVPGSPVKMTVNGTRTSTTYLDSSFVFPNSFPLTGEVTAFTLGIVYHYADTANNVRKDTTVNIPFYLKRSGDTTLPAGLDKQCWQVALGAIPVSATLLDTSGDGYLDKIDIRWTDTTAILPTMPAVAAFIKTLHLQTLDNSYDSLHAIALAPDLANKTIHVILAENNKSKVPAMETGWLSADVSLTNVAMTADGQAFAVTQIIDGAGPVIKAVYYYPGPINDSLVVIFSEPVNWTSTNPQDVFTYVQSTGQFPLANLSPSRTITNADRVTFVLPHSETIKPVSDSLRITPGTVLPITDNHGNKGPSGQANAIPIQYGPGATLIKSDFASPNPFRNDATNAATAIFVRVWRPVTNATVTIFDAVGHVVVDKKQLVADPDSALKLSCTWDGTNRSGMRVATGTYLARILVEDQPSGRKQTIKLNIGIKGKPGILR